MSRNRIDRSAYANSRSACVEDRAAKSNGSRYAVIGLRDGRAPKIRHESASRSGTNSCWENVTRRCISTSQPTFGKSLRNTNFIMFCTFNRSSSREWHTEQGLVVSKRKKKLRYDSKGWFISKSFSRSWKNPTRDIASSVWISSSSLSESTVRSEAEFARYTHCTRLQSAWKYSSFTGQLEKIVRAAMIQI